MIIGQEIVLGRQAAPPAAVRVPVRGAGACTATFAACQMGEGWAGRALQPQGKGAAAVQVVLGEAPASNADRAATGPAIVLDDNETLARRQRP